AAICAGVTLHLMSCGGSSSQTATGTPSGPPKALTPAEVSAYLENPEKLFFLDVREDEEIKEAGSIAGYVHIPIGQLETRLNEIPKDKLIITA
ncbi:MAG: hypothetical protein KIT83_22655, partial [Bryobacterales bacterium]|nr:hypothetical protein [Bryobacterales bacterium]